MAARIMQPAHYRTTRNLQDIANFIVGEPFYFPQQYYGAVFGRQLLECSIDTTAQFGAGRLLVGIAARTRQAIDFRLGVFTAEHLMAALAAAEIDREIGCDAIKPGGKARPRLEFGKVLVSTNKGFLRQFNRVILIVHDRLRHPDHAPLVSFDQNPEGLRVPVPGPFQQFCFVSVGAQ